MPRVEIVPLLAEIVLIGGGAYAIWLCVYRWQSLLDSDPSIQRLAAMFGKELARVLAILFSVGFLALGVVLMVRRLLF
jgi:hypothetical protein